MIIFKICLAKLAYVTYFREPDFIKNVFYSFLGYIHIFTIHMVCMSHAWFMHGLCIFYARVMQCIIIVYKNEIYYINFNI